MSGQDQRPKSLVESLELSRKKFAQNNIFATKKNGAYSWITYGDFATKVDQLRGGLVKTGIKKGDKVAIIARNSVEWAVAAYATYSIGAVFVAMYENQKDSEWRYIINDSGAKLVFSWDDSIHQKVLKMVGDIDSLEYAFNLTASKNAKDSYLGLLELGKKNAVEAYMPKPDELLCLIYTSGTTGNPKGVMLTHDNVLSNCFAASEIFDWSSEDTTLSFLPWAHIFGQVAELHVLIFLGYKTAFAESVQTITDNLQEIKPTLLMAVPRVFNRIYDGVNKKMRAKGGPIAALFFNGLEYKQRSKEGGSLSLKESLVLFLAEKVVFAKVRGAFGGNLRYAISGAAALDAKIGHFIDNLGITIFEGYGLSETSPMISANCNGHIKIGSVGKLIPGVQVKIDTSVATGSSEEGEIVAYGPNIMQGYYNLPEETAKVMTDDKGFRTGDIGRIDSEGYLHITGRIKEQYKLENGKYVVPSPLEETLKLSPYIDNAFIYGDNKDFNVCLLGVNMEALSEYAKTNNISGDLLKSSAIREMYQAEVLKFKDSFKEYEIPRKVTLIDEEWTPDNGFLTPSLKVKRRVVLELSLIHI